MLGNYQTGRQTLINTISSAYKQLLDSASKTIMPDVRIFNSGFSTITKLTVAFIQMNGMYRNKSWNRCLVAKRSFSRAWLRLEFLTCSCNGVVEEEKNPVTPSSSILRQVVYKQWLAKMQICLFCAWCEARFCNLSVREWQLPRRVTRRFLDRGLIGSLSNDDGDVNENGKKAIGLD